MCIRDSSYNVQYCLFWWCYLLINDWIFTSMIISLITTSWSLGSLQSHTCELEGIIFGLELSVEYFKFSQNRKPEETVYILCDCSQAIEIVQRFCFAIRFEVFKRQAHLESNALLRRLVTRVFCRDLLQAVTRSDRKLWTQILSPILWMHNEY